MVLFDVISLFTAIPVKKACDYIRNKLEGDDKLHSRTNLITDDVIYLLEFVLLNSFFVYNNCFYKQIHGCAMGSPVSPVVANLCVEVIELRIGHIVHESSPQSLETMMSMTVLSSLKRITYLIFTKN